MSTHPSGARVAGIAGDDLRAIETFYRAFEGKPELLDEAVTPDFQDLSLAPHQESGREGMKPLIRGFYAAFPDVKVKIHEIIGAPGRAAVRAEITGTHKGEWFGIAPTNRAFSLPIHEFHEIKDGRLTKTFHMEDWLGWMVQVGVWPMKGETT